MKKTQCRVCSRERGKRVCKINDNALICSPCCAHIRTPDCEGCRYYTQAAHYALAKTQHAPSKHFVMRIDPAVDEAVNHALAIVESGQMQAGERILADLLREHPDIHTVQYAMGTVCALQGQYDESLTYFDHALAIFPMFVEAWFNKALSHQKKLEVGDMIRAYQKVLELGDPAEDFVRSARETLTSLEKQIHADTGLGLEAYLRSMDTFHEAFVAMENRQWATALAGLQKVVAMNRNSPQSYGNMGICYGFLGRKQDALAAFDKALELDPHYEPARANRELAVAQEEGEKLDYEFQSIEYYKDQTVKEKSPVGRFFKRS
jgi:tetratricopeptide (TPR) repeat protein